MLIASNVYVQQALNIPVITFLGRWGSYKTLTAVATAHALLKSGRFEAVYANLPVSFASSPPVSPEDFDFRADYARNKVFIIDEAWQNFSTYDSRLIRDIFAFPRHRNQSFLLTSALPLANIRAYSHFFVQKNFNYQVVAIPLVAMECYSVKDKKPSKFFIAFPFIWFNRYSTRFDAETMSPIKQFRDSGTLYNLRSKPIPREAAEFFYINKWGLSERRDGLEDWQNRIADMFDARFDTSEAVNAKFDIPKVKRKRSLSLSTFFSTEFSVSFALSLLAIIYIMLSSFRYIWHYSPDNSPLLKCNNSIKTFFVMGDFTPNTCNKEGGTNEPKRTQQTTTIQQSTATATSTAQPTATATIQSAATEWNFRKSRAP